MKTVALFLLLACTLGAQNWGSFRGPQASGVADGQDPPTNFQVLWKTPMPGLAHASPVVWGDRVFIATAISSDPKAVFRHGLFGDVEPSGDVSRHTWRIYCLDRMSGKILWEQTAHEGVPKVKRHPKSSQASSTPATDGKHVVVYFGSEGLYGYTVDGKLVWKQDLGIQDAGWFFDPDYQWGPASSPIIHKGRVYVQCDRQQDSFVAAYDLATGKPVWTTPRKEIPSWGTPTVYEGKTRAELVTNGTRSIRGYDPETGKELWRLSRNSEVTVTTPIAAHDLIFVSNGYPPVQPVYAIKPGASGDITLKEGTSSSDSIAWSYLRGGVYMPTPLVYGDLLYTCSNNGILTAYNAKSGERVYQQRVAQGGAYSASPVAADGKLYLTSEDGDIHVLRAGPKYELLATNPVGEVLMATPAITPGMLIVRGEHHVFGIGGKK
ncbi:MAG: PQQ-binding-like beta-propeller repeat protein [Acidobacteria bacterium]|nr:PQQ-binding-like beta-propeller repeat protein [Acidobacteriota bacterium]